jgi:hypothetical protein
VVVDASPRQVKLVRMHLPPRPAEDGEEEERS